MLLRVFWILVLSGAIFWSCQDNRAIINSEKYQGEELVVYQQLMDALLDSAGFDEVDPNKQVFYVSDTLDNLDNRTNSNGLLKIDITKRTFSIQNLTVNSRHKFVKIKDSLKLKGDEYFTRQWLRLSRIGFDKSMNSGFLRIEIWCGFLCGAGYQYEVEKVDLKWRIKSYRMTSVS